MDDLQKTEFVIAKILARLMERGVQAGFIDFSNEIRDPDLEPFIAPCFRWLEAEGVVRTRNYAETLDGFEVNEPSLTSYGFQMMGAPISLNGDEQKLSAAVQQVSNGQRSYSQIGDFFGGLLGGFTKSLGS